MATKKTTSASAKKTTNVNVFKLMSKCPHDAKFYSPMIGWIDNWDLDESSYNGGADSIFIENADTAIYLNSFGQYHKTGCCMIWPSKNVRSWKDFDPNKHAKYSKDEFKNEDGSIPDLSVAVGATDSKDNTLAELNENFEKFKEAVESIDANDKVLEESVLDIDEMNFMEISL